jgi:hypothetical protein
MKCRLSLNVFPSGPDEEILYIQHPMVEMLISLAPHEGIPFV